MNIIKKIIKNIKQKRKLKKFLKSNSKKYIPVKKIKDFDLVCSILGYKFMDTSYKYHTLYLKEKKGYVYISTSYLHAINDGQKVFMKNIKNDIYELKRFKNYFNL